MALQTSAEIDNPTRDARQRPSAASGGPVEPLRGEDSVTTVFCSRKRDRLEGADPPSRLGLIGLRNANATSQTLAPRPVVVGTELYERVCLQNLPGLLSAIASRRII